MAACNSFPVQYHLESLAMKVVRSYYKILTMHIRVVEGDINLLVVEVVCR